MIGSGDPDDDGAGRGDRSSHRRRLIAEIYEVALRPDRYGSFIDLWETELERAVARLRDLDGSAAATAVADPELEDHFRRAYLILEQMGRRIPSGMSPEAFVGQDKNPCMLFAASGELQAANSAAAHHFGAVPTLRIFADRHLDAGDRRLTDMLLRLERPQLSGELHVFATELSRPPGNRQTSRLFVARPVRLAPETPALLAISTLAVPWSADLERLLQGSFGLTSSEIRVIHDLADGQSLRDAAYLHKRSEHTLRTQLKSVLAKTRSASQSDLMRTVATLAAHAAAGATRAVPARQEPRTGVRILVAVSGNRQLPVNLIGPADGKPVLFIHGMLDGFSVSPQINSLLDRYGLRLIAPSRPGFGESPPVEDIRNAPRLFAADIVRLLDALDIDHCPVIGHMAGAVHAYCAASQPGSRISAVISVAGAVPIISLRQFSAMAPRQRVVAWTARFTPGLLPTILRAGIAQIDQGGEDAFMNALYPGDSIDSRSLSNPDVKAAIIDGYKFAVAQGHRAFEADAWHVTRDWSDYLGPGLPPVRIIHGVHDPVVTIESVRAFAGSNKGFHLTEEEDCGQLVFFQRPELVFASIARMADQTG